MLPKRLNHNFLFSALGLALSAMVSADQLVLTNGDTLSGELQEQTDTYVIWQSDNFGALKIAAKRIATINGLSLNANKAPVFRNTYKGGLSFTGGFASGNQKREDWDLESNVEWREGDFRHSSDVNFESHSLAGSEPKEEFALGHSVDWFFQEKWYLSNGVAWGGDDDRSVDHFYSVGSAIGRQFWDTPAKSLSAETGLVWISESLNDQTKDQRLTWSWAADYRRNLMHRMELFHTHKVLIALTDFEDTELRANLGLRVPVVENLFTEIKLEWIFDNQPADGKKPTDTQLSIGVNYGW